MRSPVFSGPECGTLGPTRVHRCQCEGVRSSSGHSPAAARGACPGKSEADSEPSLAPGTGHLPGCHEATQSCLCLDPMHLPTRLRQDQSGGLWPSRRLVLPPPMPPVLPPPLPPVLPPPMPPVARPPRTGSHQPLPPGTPSSRKLMAVPFVGKDVPSRSSEFGVLMGGWAVWG